MLYSHWNAAITCRYQLKKAGSSDWGKAGENMGLMQDDGSGIKVANSGKREKPIALYSCYISRAHAYELSQSLGTPPQLVLPALCECSVRVDTISDWHVGNCVGFAHLPRLATLYPTRKARKTCIPSRSHARDEPKHESHDRGHR